MADKIWIPVSGSSPRLWAPGTDVPGGDTPATGTRPAAQQPAAGSAGAVRGAPDPAETGDAASRPQPVSGGDGGAGDDKADASAAGVQTVTEVQAQRDEYLDNLQRLKAEFDNYRRRTRQEAREASEHAKKSLLTEFLPVLDNLERALAAAEHHQEGKVLAGVRMTQGQFLDLLKRHGVEPIDPLGQPFDPALHDAMLSQASAEPEGTVFAVLEKGYTLGDQIVRPARVAVSSGPGGEAEE